MILRRGCHAFSLLAFSSGRLPQGRRTALPVASRPAAALVSGGAANRFRLFIHHIAATQDEAGEKSFDEGLESGPKAGKSKGKKQYA